MHDMEKIKVAEGPFHKYMGHRSRRGRCLGTKEEE